MGWPQQMSAPWPGFVTMNSEPHLVQKYRFPTWFAMSYHPNKVYRRSAYAVNMREQMRRRQPISLAFFFALGLDKPMIIWHYAQ